MRKLSLFLACVLIFTLVSCAGGGDSTREPTAASDAPTVVPTEPSAEPSLEKLTEEKTDTFSEAPSEMKSEVLSSEASSEAPSESMEESLPSEPDSGNEEETALFALVFKEENSECIVTGYEGNALHVEIPESHNGLPVTVIGENAFANCQTLESVSFPSTLKTIRAGAFKECKALKSVDLPANLLAIEANAFQRCNAIQNVCYGGTKEAFKKIEVGVRNHTLTGAELTYLNQPSIHDEPEVPEEGEKPMDKIYTIIEPKSMTLSNGDTFNYRMYVPENYDASKAYPVLILLHGAGERGHDNALQMKNMVATLFADEDSPIQDSIFLCPQCPTDNQWVDTPWAEGDYRTDEVPESNELQGVLEMLASVRESHNVDPNRIYIMGISMGGFGTWDMIIRHPDIFAAAIPICGGGDSSKAEVIAHIPIRTFHGDADKSVPVEGTRAMVEALRAVGGNIEYEELAGYTHNVWDYVAQKEGLMDWLFSQRKGETDIEVNIVNLLER